MALLEDIAKAEGAGPLVLGVGALMLAPALLPAIGRVLRPIAKGVIKTGIAIYDETYATVREATGDLVAEARSELEHETHVRESERERGRHEAPATSM